MNTAQRTILIVVILSVVLAGMVTKKQYTLNTGTPILLETQPIDPRSLFRGDYVRLNYTISNLNFGELDGDDEFLRNDTIYVALQKDETYWHAVSVHRQRPDVPEGQIIVKGRVIMRGTAMVSVKYGIENYFVPEGEGRDLERPSADHKVDLRIAVDRFGNAGIRAVLVNGEERYQETLF